MSHTTLSNIQLTVTSRRRAETDQEATCCNFASGGQSAQSAAIAAFNVLAVWCMQTAGVINQYPVGPYADNGSCTYDCGFMEQKWSWTADYRGVNASLMSLASENNLLSQYTNAFQPTNLWLNTDLAQFTAAFKLYTTDIRAIDTAIIAAGGNATPAQLNSLQNDFNNLAASDAKSLNEVNAGLQSLAQFINSVYPSGLSMHGSLTNDGTSIQADINKNQNDLIGQISCGDGDVTNSFNNLKAQITGQLTAMDVDCCRVDNSLQAALSAGQSVLGTFLVLQQDCILVNNQITKVESFPPTSLLRILNLNIADALWADLVTYANAQLQES
jgi:hypothetical protein